MAEQLLKTGQPPKEFGPVQVMEMKVYCEAHYQRLAWGGLQELKKERTETGRRQFADRP